MLDFASHSQGWRNNHFPHHCFQLHKGDKQISVELLISNNVIIVTTNLTVIFITYRPNMTHQLFGNWISNHVPTETKDQS